MTRGKGNETIVSSVLLLSLSAIPSFAPQTQLGWAGGGAERVARRNPNETTGECNAFDHRRAAISSPVAKLLQISMVLHTQDMVQMLAI